MTRTFAALPRARLDGRPYRRYLPEREDGRVWPAGIENTLALSFHFGRRAYAHREFVKEDLTRAVRQAKGWWW